MKCSFEKSDVISPIFCAWSRLESLARRHIFGCVGLSSSTFKILAFLARGQAATPSEMIAELEITKSNLSQRLHILEEKRFVQRSSPKKDCDKRKILFSITAAGTRKLLEASRVAKRAGLSFEKEFSRDEVRRHQAFFLKFIRLLDEKERELGHSAKK